MALGLSTHYRFFLYPIAAILFLSFYAPARSQFRNPKLWLATIIASIGLTPILWFNMNNELSSASFYFVDRHPWEFEPTGLLHVIKQAGLSTPPLYAMFLFTIFILYRKLKKGNLSAALLFSMAVTNLSVYLVLSLIHI